MCRAGSQFLAIPGVSRSVGVDCSFTITSLMSTRFYQLHVAKSMTDKLSNVNTEMDKIINQANTEIGNLQNKLASKSIDTRNGGFP
jgi:hypothetical protein